MQAHRYRVPARGDAGAIRALTNALVIGIHQGGHDRLALPDHKGIHDLRKRFGVEGRTRPTRDDQRVPCTALGCVQTHMAERQYLDEHFDDVEIVHLKGNGKADDGEVRKRRLRLHAHHRRLRALIAREFRPIGQEEALARGISAPVEEVIDDVQTEIRHPHKVGVGIDERKARASSRRIAIAAALLCKALLQTALQSMIQVLPLSF